MMPPSLFRSRGFSAASATMLLTNMGMFGVSFLVSQFLQSVMGYTSLEAGVRGLPWTAAPAVTAPIAGLLSDRLGGRRIVAVGVALQAIGIGWLAAEITATTPYADLILPFLIAGPAGSPACRRERRPGDPRPAARCHGPACVTRKPQPARTGPSTRL